jgi:proteasome lid subunit RPN8/RPN11
VDDMIAHAGEAIPHEAVGLLGGVDGTVRRRVPLPNLLGVGAFLVDPYAQFRALRALRADGLEPLAIYHSHPAGGVRPSGDDLRFASRLPYVQLIVAIARPHDPAVEIAAYDVTPTAVRAVALAVTPE